MLTTVTSVDPPANSHTAAVSTDVSATFDEVINAASATAANFVVASAQSGVLTAADAAVTASGMTVTLDPNENFFPGERVRVTATGGIQGTSAAVPRVWQFQTEVTSGSGQFEDAGQDIGDVSTAGQTGSLGDMDGDGDLDLFLGINGTNLLSFNDGEGVFSDSGQSLGGGNSFDASLGDLDGDGDLDAVVVNSNQANVVWINNGSGVFAQGGTFGATNPSRGVELGDLDGDGDLDIFVGNYGRGNRVYSNNGSASFVDTGQTLGNSVSQEVEVGDLDGDGDLDAIVGNRYQGNRVWSNDGTGVFTDSGQSIGFNLSEGLGIGDVDGDGDLDAIEANQSGGVGSKLFLNNGSGVFTDSGQQLGGGANSFSVAVGDLDGDGDLDYVVGNNNPNRHYLNDGAGIFTIAPSMGGAGSNTRRTPLGDVDGDGDLDIVSINIAGGSPSGSRIWTNQNLAPSVTLGVDTTAIAEAAGVATATATLSAVHNQDVTIDLATSGSATVTDDYTISATQIVIPVGATTGSVTVTAVQDTDDEPDETVIVDIAGVTNGQEAGSQQVTVTILDDDEPAPVPDVTLSVDNSAIPEEAGVATFTATLSVVTTVEVTVDVGFSGSAAASDYTASGSQIVIAPGATTGAVTVTAVQDTEDESDETVIVDVTSVTGGNESGTQQQTTTITDDDEPVVPDVTLSVDEASIPEAAGVATFTATLSETTTVPVTVDLEMTGSATAGDDYNASGTQIVIAAGETTGSVSVTAVQDEQDEPDETVVVDISAVTGGTESGTQQATTTIADDDEPTGFAVTALTRTSTGFQVAFTNEIDVADLSLYDTQTAGLGPADVVLTGATSGPVSGSLVVDASGRMVEFIKTGDALTPDTYTVTLRSATDGFEDTGGLLLDGDGDGTGGDDYSSAFTVDEPAAGTVTVGIPDIVRGPGQEVNLPADATTGIPLTISDGTNIRAIDARISYDPTLLNITAATLGPDAPSGASVILNSSTPGLAIVVYFATAPLPAGAGTFVNLQASVPTDNASENYRRQQVLDVHDVIVSDGNDNESPVIENDALQVTTFFADVTANGRINAADAAGVARIAALLDGGFLGTPSTDPGLVGDISGNGRLNAADASLVAQFAALLPVSQIPAIPGGVVVTWLPSSPQDFSPGDDLRWLGSNSEERAVSPQDFGVRDDTAHQDLVTRSHDRAMGDIDELPLALEDAIDDLLSGL